MDTIKSVLLSMMVFASTPNTTEYLAPPIEDIIPFEEVELTMPELVDFYADKWGVSRTQLRTVVKCESGFNPDAFNGNDVHKLSVGSLGIAQFSTQTFSQYAKEMGKTEYSNPYNPNEALDVMAYMFSKGKAGHWSCYKRFYS